jgi:hypothetical protein
VNVLPTVGVTTHPVGVPAVTSGRLSPTETGLLAVLAGAVNPPPVAFSRGLQLAVRVEVVAQFKKVGGAIGAHVSLMAPLTVRTVTLPAAFVPFTPFVPFSPLTPFGPGVPGTPCSFQLIER